ncbi:MAG: potassium-transporting ATPase subunit KdpA, partial [Marmoricola sp.]|nr:potassium-transporting ATPase subunit KdpA [Marmoricola sp.]
MSTTLLFILQVLTLIIVLGLINRPFGDNMAHVYTTDKNIKVERGFYRLIGVDARGQQTWSAYLRGVLAFSLMG